MLRFLFVPFSLCCLLSLVAVPVDAGIGDYIRFYKNDYYGDLGVSKDATSSEIRKAYRELSMIWHPDKNSDPGAEARFRSVAEAYEQLKSPALRAEYDDFVASLPPMMRPGDASRTDVRLVLAFLLLLMCAMHYGSLRSRHAAVVEKCRSSARFAALVAEAREKGDGFEHAGRRRAGMSDEDLCLEVTLEQSGNVAPGPLDVFLLVPFAMLLRTLGVLPPKPVPVQEQPQAPEPGVLTEEEAAAIAEHKRILDEQRRAKKEQAKSEMQRRRDLEAERAAAALESQARKEAEIERAAAEEKKRAKRARAGLRNAFKSLPSKTAPNGSGGNNRKDNGNGIDVDAIIEALPVERLEGIAGKCDANPGDAAGVFARAMAEAEAVLEKRRAEEAERRRLIEEKHARSASAAVPSKPWAKPEVKLLLDAYVKFPGGTRDRWERMAEVIPGRTPAEVLAKVKEIRKAQLK